MKSILLVLLINSLLLSNDLINKTGIKKDYSENLVGIDKNNNEIRDDIEELIKNASPNEAHKKAFENLAKLDRKLFKLYEIMDILKIDETIILRKKAEKCMEEVFKDIPTSSPYNYFILRTRYKNEFLNTEKRKEKFNEIMNHYNANIIFDKPDPKNCYKIEIDTDIF